MMIRIFFASAIALGLIACGQQTGETIQSASEPLAQSDKVVAEGAVVATGEFEGASKHVTTGGVTIRQAADGFYVTLEDDFSLDGAPEPRLGFGDPDYVVETQFSELKSKTGHQSYKLPEGFDPMAYQTIYVWCEKFEVPLGVATLG